MKTYVFRVRLKDNKNVWRDVEIKADQTLADLHNIIFSTFNRYEPHLYSFFLSNQPWDNESEYGLPYEGFAGVKDSRQAKLDELGIQSGHKFLYVFDYGDEWWHALELKKI
ncbi:MAG: plasmid pRiA4b ORF-3 family protein, partial [Deltaproteobacteria bacterium]|nr:plasmid pRiA4b ORF-3 family protein [Deltaproteobacteria bacterium]